MRTIPYVRLLRKEDDAATAAELRARAHRLRAQASELLAQAEERDAAPSDDAVVTASDFQQFGFTSRRAMSEALRTCIHSVKAGRVRGAFRRDVEAYLASRRREPNPPTTGANLDDDYAAIAGSRS